MYGKVMNDIIKPFGMSPRLIKILSLFHISNFLEECSGSISAKVISNLQYGFDNRIPN